jgi:hypothetical protein
VFKKILLVGLVSAAAVLAGPKTDLPGRNNGTSTIFVDCPHHNDTASNGDTIFTRTLGLTFTGGDYTPDASMHGLMLVNGSGNISVVLSGGGQLVFPCIVDSGDVFEVLRGYSIATVDSALTTFTGRIFPLF